MPYNSDDYVPQTGKNIKSDNSIVNEADGYNADGSQNIVIIKRRQTTIQTHTNTSIGANLSNPSAWIDTDGYTDFAITLTSDSSTASNNVTLNWSNDGVNVQGWEQPIASGARQYGAATTPTKARWVKVIVGNNDATNPHVFNAWAYLKA